MDRPLNILYLIPDNISPDEESGAINHIRGITRAFEKRGAKLQTLYYLKPRPLSQTSTLRSKDLRWIPFRAFLRSIKNDLSYVLRNVRFYRMCRQALGREHFKPDLIYERSCYLQVAGLLLSKRLKIPIFYEVNGLPVSEAKKSWNSRLTWLGGWIERIKYHRASITFTVGTLHKHVDAPKANFLSVQNGIDAELFNQSTGADSKPTSQKLVVGFLGFVLPWYNLDLIKAAFLTLRSKWPQLHILIVGWGESVDRFRAFCEQENLSGSFTFTGRVSRSEAMKLTATMDVATIPFCVPYGSSIKLFEYGLLKKPVLVPDYENFRSILGEEHVQFYAPDDPNDFASALEKLLADPSLRKTLGENLHALVRTKYTWDAIGEFEWSAIQEALRAKI